MAEYIEKEAAIQTIITDRWIERIIAGKATVRDMIDALPAADVRENVRGEWVATDGYMVDECSNCHFQICWDDVPSWLERLPHFTNQCPNCGADMRGGAQ